MRLIGISFGYFMVLLDTTVLAVAEPDLATSLATSVGGLQWITVAYTVAFAALLLPAGALTDRMGAQYTFRLAVLAFGLLSALCAIAPAVWVLTGLRVLLGAAAAGCVPASLALVARLYPDAAARAGAVATWAAVSGSAVALGPVVGGALVGGFGWRAIFLVNVPIAALVLATTAGPQLAGPRSPRSIDVLGHIAVAAALALATGALIAASNGNAATATATAAGSGAAVAALAVVVRGRRSSAPALDPAVLRAPGVLAGIAAAAAVNLAMSGTLFVLPLALAGRFGPAATGIALLPMTLPFVLNPPVTGRLVARFGPRPPVLAGLGLLACGTGGLGAAVQTGAAYPWIAAGLAAVGFGVSLTLPALVGAVVSAVPAGATGAASGTLNAARQAGATAGVALMGAAAGGAAFVPAVLACGAALAVYALTTRPTAPESSVRGPISSTG